MKILYWLIILLGGYLLGSLNISIILSRILGRDIRKQGSGNAGATNMTRVFGWAAGVATLAFDVLKAFAAMWIGRKLLGNTGVSLGGMAVMAGHCFPVFYNFKGGKGIATGAAVGFMIDWRVGDCSGVPARGDHQQKGFRRVSGSCGCYYSFNVDF